MSAPRHTIAQIDAALTHPGGCRQAGAALGIDHSTIGNWRAGALPAFYRRAKGDLSCPASRPKRLRPIAVPKPKPDPGPIVTAMPAATAVARAARFVRPQDARAGR